MVVAGLYACVAVAVFCVCMLAVGLFFCLVVKGWFVFSSCRITILYVDLRNMWWL